MAQGQAGGAQRVGGDRGHPLGPLGDAAQPGRAVVGGVEPGDVGQQDLGRADVRRRLLATDVLLARLQREAQRGPPGGVGADADDAPGQGAGGRLVGGDERGMGTTEHHRHAEALRRADRDVGAELTRRRRQHARQQVGGDDGEAAGGVDALDRRPPVDDRAGRGRQAEQRSEAAVVDGVDVADDDLDADRLGPGGEHGDRLRVGVVVDDEAVARRPA